MELIAPLQITLSHFCDRRGWARRLVANRPRWVSFLGEGALK